jgi:hypothetical protein
MYDHSMKGTTNWSPAAPKRSCGSTIEKDPSEPSPNGHLTVTPAVNNEDAHVEYVLAGGGGLEPPTS